jgi:hypothetical protein
VLNATQASRQIATHKNEALLCFLSRLTLGDPREPAP